MDINSINKFIDGKIEGKRLIRDNEVYKVFGLDKTSPIYNATVCNAACIINAFSLSDIAIAAAAGTVVFYESVKYRHYLTREIEALKEYKSVLKSGYIPSELRYFTKEELIEFYNKKEQEFEDNLVKEAEKKTKKLMK